MRPFLFPRELTRYILEDPSGPFLELEWPERLFEDVEGRNEADDEEPAPGAWRRWQFQFSKREPFLLKADWRLGFLEVKKIDHMFMEEIGLCRIEDMYKYGCLIIYIIETCCVGVP